jgi:hypothetical protein
MESQQIVDYISRHLSAGHTEANLREHLMSSGWSQTATDDAFSRYHQSGLAALQLAPAARRSRRYLRLKWSKIRHLKAIVAGVLAVALLAVGAHIIASYQASHKVIPPPPPLTFGQKQSIDANNLGGAVGQYVLINGAPPTSVSVGSDGNLVLCGTICDPVTSEVVPLAVYQANEVKYEQYAAGLAVPNSQTMYLVAGANCTGPRRSLNASTNPKAMAIEYAQPNKSQLTQRCVTL